MDPFRHAVEELFFQHFICLTRLIARRRNTILVITSDYM